MQDSEVTLVFFMGKVGPLNDECPLFEASIAVWALRVAPLLHCISESVNLVLGLMAHSSVEPGLTSQWPKLRGCTPTPPTRSAQRDNVWLYGSQP
jgi:hypothetical protein